MNSDISTYINRTNKIRYPIYRIDLLRHDETPFYSLTNKVINDSGSVNSTNENGVRRTCNFEIIDIGENDYDVIASITIGSKFKVWIGENVEGNDVLFERGVFLFDDPTITRSQSQKKISLSGTDKWSILNGAHGGIVEGTYTVHSGSTLGDMIRKTLILDIVNDPIEPNIHPSLENFVITYDITKGEGGTVADILLDVATNANANIFYDTNGRLNVLPIADDTFGGIAHIFDDEDENIISIEKKVEILTVYNSVMVMAENVDETEGIISVEVQNTDLSDPNSIPNCGVKKTYIVGEYLNGISTQQQARERAVYELRKIKKQYSTISISCLPILFLNCGDIISVHNEGIRANGEKYCINSINDAIGDNLGTTIEASLIREE